MIGFDPSHLHAAIAAHVAQMTPAQRKAWGDIVETSRDGLRKDPLGAMWGFISALYPHADSAKTIRAGLLGMALAINEASSSRK